MSKSLRSFWYLLQYFLISLHMCTLLLVFTFSLLHRIAIFPVLKYALSMFYCRQYFFRSLTCEHHKPKTSFISYTLISPLNLSDCGIVLCAGVHFQSNGTRYYGQWYTRRHRKVRKGSAPSSHISVSFSGA